MKLVIWDAIAPIITPSLWTCINTEKRRHWWLDYSSIEENKFVTHYWLYVRKLHRVLVDSTHNVPEMRDLIVSSYLSPLSPDIDPAWEQNSSNQRLCVFRSAPFKRTWLEKQPLDIPTPVNICSNISDTTRSVMEPDYLYSKVLFSSLCQVEHADPLKK